MKRRATYVAATVIAVAVLVIGLGARQEGADEPVGELCDDLEFVFRGCERGREHSECQHVPERFGDACQAGCVATYCPEKVSCTELDPMWCAPCDDLYGARFWALTNDAQVPCDKAFHLPIAQEEHDKVDWAGVDACWRAEMERQCPGLAKTDWFARLRAE